MSLNLEQTKEHLCGGDLQVSSNPFAVDGATGQHTYRDLATVNACNNALQRYRRIGTEFCRATNCGAEVSDQLRNLCRFNFR
jgi:hypothetical protein